MAEFLAEVCFEKWKDNQRLKPIMWRGEEVADRVAKIHVDKFLNTVEGAKSVFMSLLEYGVALIENVGLLT